jgi:hypothetical protein
MPSVAKFSRPPETAMRSQALLEASTPADVLPEARSSRAWKILSRWFTRTTCSQAYIPEVDGLRFLAILPVLILHVTSHLLLEKGWRPGSLSGDWTGNGWVLEIVSAGGSGVQLFFVLSGFIVALPFARHQLDNNPAPSLGNYLLRRATRIEPPYIIALTAAYLLFHRYRFALPHYLAGLFYAHQFIYSARNPLNPGTWSLEAEIVFYLLAPWLSRMYRIPGSLERRCLQLALITLSSWTLYHQLLPFASPRVTGTFVTGLPYFLTGMLLADLYVSGLIAKAQSVAWDIAAAVAAVLIVLPAFGRRHLLDQPVSADGNLPGSLQRRYPAQVSPLAACHHHWGHVLQLVSLASCSDGLVGPLPLHPASAWTGFQHLHHRLLPSRHSVSYRRHRSSLSPDRETVYEWTRLTISGSQPAPPRSCRPPPLQRPRPTFRDSGGRLVGH